MTWQCVRRFSGETELAWLNQLLMLSRIPHRFVEQGGGIQLWMEGGWPTDAVLKLLDNLQGEACVLLPTDNSVLPFTLRGLDGEGKPIAPSETIQKAVAQFSEVMRTQSQAEADGPETSSSAESLAFEGEAPAVSEQAASEAPTQLQEKRSNVGGFFLPGLHPFSWQAIQRVPLTLLLIILGVMGALGVHFGMDVTIDIFASVQYSHAIHVPHIWQYLTPVFLHFSVFHVVFNSVLLWEFGKRIELVFGATWFFGLFLLFALASNGAQLSVIEPGVPFGGLSGVVYGCFGFLFVLGKLQKHPAFQLLPGIVWMMFISLFLGVFGIIDWFIAGSVANAAHVGGLVMGLLAGWAVVCYQRLVLKN